MATVAAVVPTPVPVPPNVSFFTAVWRALAITGDTLDIGRDPDSGVFTGVQVTFRSATGVFDDATATPRSSLFPQIVTCGLNALGDLVGVDGVAGVKLVADDPDLEPEAAGYWDVLITNTSVDILPFRIHGTPGGTVDLAAYVRDGATISDVVPPGGGSGITGFEAAADAATVELTITTSEAPRIVTLPVASASQAGVPTAAQVASWNAGGTPSSDDITDATSVGKAVLTASNAGAARSAIGAGTSSLVLGTTSGTAKAGDYAPPSTSTTVQGVVELATTAETTTGTDASRAVTPAGLAAQKGIANGLASLDSGGRVPSAQLPAGTDDVQEFANRAAFPGTGTAGVLYLALDTNHMWRWTGTTYAELPVAPGTTTDLVEGTNLYYTDARANARADARIAAKTNVSGGVQGYDADLAGFASATSVANTVPYATGVGTFAYAAFGSDSRALLAAATPALKRAALSAQELPLVDTLANLAAYATANPTSLRDLYANDVYGVTPYRIVGGLLTKSGRGALEPGIIPVGEVSLNSVTAVTSTTFTTVGLSLDVTLAYGGALRFEIEGAGFLQWTGATNGTDYGIALRIIDSAGRVVLEDKQKHRVPTASGSEPLYFFSRRVFPPGYNAVDTWQVYAAKIAPAGDTHLTASLYGGTGRAIPASMVYGAAPVAQPIRFGAEVH